MARRRYKIGYYPRANTHTVETGNLVLTYHASEGAAERDRQRMLADPDYAERRYQEAIDAEETS
jgi:hypothetical protein